MESIHYKKLFIQKIQHQEFIDKLDEVGSLTILCMWTGRLQEADAKD